MKWFLVLAFILFIIGYVYLSTCAHLYTNYQELFTLYKSFCCMKIDINFLVVLVGLYGAVIAFFVPLSIDMVSKIGKMYETDVIAEMFKNESEVKNIHNHLLSGIVGIAFTIALSKTLHTFVLLFIIFFIAVHFLFVVHSIHSFINKLKFYTDTDSVLKLLQQELKDVIGK